MVRTGTHAQVLLCRVLVVGTLGMSGCNTPKFFGKSGGQGRPPADAPPSGSDLKQRLLPRGALPAGLGLAGVYPLSNAEVAQFFPDPAAALHAMTTAGRLDGAAAVYERRTAGADDAVLAVSSSIAWYRTTAGAEAVFTDPTLALVANRVGLQVVEVPVAHRAGPARGFRGVRRGDPTDWLTYLIMFQRQHTVGAVVVVLLAAADDGGKLALNLAERQATTRVLPAPVPNRAAAAVPAVAPTQRWAVSPALLSPYAVQRMLPELAIIGAGPRGRRQAACTAARSAPRRRNGRNPRRRKYARLATFLAAQSADAVTLTFAAIDALLGTPLPASAYLRSWWLNTGRWRPQVRAWLDIGWQVQALDLRERRVTFARQTPSSAGLAVSPRGGLLARAARSAAGQPPLVGHALALYQARHGLDEAALAAHLGCAVQRLHGLALCRLPRPGGESFRAEVERLAAFIGCDADRLAAVIMATYAQPPGPVG